ncbi:MAG: CBS domain-containing protein [Bacillota bacterium]|nr:CBS domain-containing protein [Bacillota bacterium]MDD3298756.1 CBS domain-containing protein [Bacillota bacterium]MDD3850890.1 CBS domain-containing protein [Bacillota bacterium]MDD4707846.1 CBS domain-containing protein [Bacillota bacterium]
MKLADIMTRDVRTIDASSTVEDAARMMKELNVGSLPVSENGSITGIITDRDVVLRNVAGGRTPTNTRVDEVMSKTVITATPDMDVHRAADLMAQNQIRRLPVLENNRMVGIVSIGDLAVRNIYENEAGEALSSISKPSRPSL